MKFSLRRSAASVLATASLLCLAVTAAPGQSSNVQRTEQKKLNEAAKESRDATKVFNEIMRVPDKAIPKELLDRAEAIAVFPGVLRAAFVIGGRARLPADARPVFKQVNTSTPAIVHTLKED